MTQSEPRLLMFMHLDMGPAQHLRGDDGESRLIYHVRGGYFKGDRLSGTVLPVAGDWASVKDGKVTMDVRMLLRTDDGAEICVSYNGIAAVRPELLKSLEAGADIAATNHYFAVVPVLEVRGEAYSWLPGLSVFGIGTRYDDCIEYHVYENVSVSDDVVGGNDLQLSIERQ